MSIKIIKPGVLTTLHDAGRSGHRGIGIGTGGAMDIFAMKAANYLCGNDDQQAVMETSFPAPEILFQQDAIISLAGADFAATINNTAIPVWKTILVKKGSLLQFKQPLSGSKLYLAVHGGWQAQQWLNSYSTHLKLAVGGYSGRALQKNDVINFRKHNFSFEANVILSHRISAYQLEKIYQPQNNIRCIKGVEYDWLNETAKNNFEKNNFIISNQSDRMGLRLTGNTIMLQQTTELISSAVDAGVIQLLPDGNCIVLMADHQTTGGYPRIASVIKADLPKLAQLNPNNKISFAIITLKEAEDALISTQQILMEIKNGCQLYLEKYLIH
ncbi:biotin-dependent carboxyltransferase family protein [Ferruginibacter sp. SUN106]|uniref:5-oxoprolinase subunit C family protein n=1 Tax=Ferruginibacter sp. SUN106 TaxID=2978348 RepID=UPI003D361492